MFQDTEQIKKPDKPRKDINAKGKNVLSHFFAALAVIPIDCFRRKAQQLINAREANKYK